MQILKKILYLRPQEIESQNNPSRQQNDEYELNSLAVSVAANGVIEPLVVRRSYDGGYTLVSGHRRLNAARIAGLRRVPCLLQNADNLSCDILALTENLQRSDLHFFEEAAAIERIINTYNISTAEVAARLGLALPAVHSKLKLLILSEKLRHRITSSALTEAHARALLRLPDHARDSALDRIISEGMSVRHTEGFIDSLLFPEEEPLEIDLRASIREDEPQREPVRKSAIGDEKLFANSLSKLVATMQNSGFNAHSRKYETEAYIEYRVRIQKALQESPTQLKLV